MELRFLIVAFVSSIWVCHHSVALHTLHRGETLGPSERRKKGDTFEIRSGGFRLSPRSHGRENHYNKSVGYSDCREACWNDCTCMGFLAGQEIGCVIYNNSNFYFVEDVTGQAVKYNVFSRVKKGNREVIWIAIAVSGSVCVSLLAVFYSLRMKVKSQGYESASHLRETELEMEGNEDWNLRVFSYSCVAEATSNFSEEFKLSEGRFFGPVYKGRLPEGQQIAVKQFSIAPGKIWSEFKKELLLIARLQHVSLVRLLGYCVREIGERQDRMLIYEYMPNKSLDLFLFDPSRKEVLDWSLRVKIIDGVLQGLLYLHKYSGLNITHGDIKACNILLDDNMNPKMSIFGMARIFKQDDLLADASRSIGAFLYSQTEQVMRKIFSEKSDVFSFGVLLLEILSGLKTTSYSDSNYPFNLVAHAWELWQRNAAIELADPTLGAAFPEQQFVRLAHAALSCVEENERDRPTLSQVAAMLANDSLLLLELKNPAFFGRSGMIAIDDCQMKLSFFFW